MTTLTHRLDRLASAWAMTRSELLFSFFLVFAFVSGVQAHVMPQVYPLTRYITDALLLAVCLPLLWFAWQRRQDKQFVWWILATYWITFFTEVAGVATGAIFGEYRYGPTMWIQWLNVPLVIALNWTLLIMATAQLAAKLSVRPVVASILTGVFIVAYDYFIEPVAIALDYWQWAGGEIPNQNYLAWGLIAGVLSYPLHRLQISYQTPVLYVYAVAQFIFFVGLQVLL
ncbi:MAG: carotenoid biosynthesis protein [Bacteroidetes bacterium]|nr:MAG: carotenoid biosynthesis protein [Bacteroidota bacterium]